MTNNDMTNTTRSGRSRLRSHLSRRLPRRWAVGAGAVVAAGAVAAATLTTGHTPARHPGSAAAKLAASACHGPAGAAYVADAGWDGFSAIDTATCKVIQTYNVGDPAVPNDPGDYDYDSTDEAVAIHGNLLYFANTGNSTVAVIDTSKLVASNYNPAETLINVGLNPQHLAVSPDGSQVWVAETGPQTSPSSPSAVSVISTATNKVTARWSLPGGPSQIAFAPSGQRVYVATSAGVAVYSTATQRQVAFIRGLGDPRGIAVSPDGKAVYVTGTNSDELYTISAAANRVTGTVKVGDLPWQVVAAPDGKTVYVANPDSNSVSVISAATGAVTSTVSVPGDPDTLALTPDGTQLWIGASTAAKVTVLNTADNSTVGVINLGDEPNAADGYAPTGIALTATPTAGS
jgi:YVTN family beta-propeller protein